MREKIALALLFAAAVALPLIMRALDLPGGTGVATSILCLAFAASSLNLILGHGGMISFGHAAYYGIGAYTVGILWEHFRQQEPIFGLIPGTDQLLITLPAAMLTAGLAAAVIGALSLRTSGVQFIMITLAFAQMLFFLFVGLKAYGGDDGMTIRRRNAVPGLDLRDVDQLYWLVLGLLCAWLFLQWRIVGSRFGRVLEGIRQNERRMRAIGISPYPYKLAAFVIAGMGAGAAGALMANYMRFVSPDIMSWQKSGEIMVVVILGGIGTLLGPVLGAIALQGLEFFLGGITEHWAIILGPILVLVVLFGRGGIMALIRRLLGVRHG
ncbi:branched-chain amino acid ABC transporter permease [Rhodovarius crocodyli]|uniref:Branched-chain amino acid ABC transporter permease n=1 Tax=Rhodovarius crocodyli TaxID=1979269 RepID=A0A437LZ88_9PROT|nr:branched-chain amino acid ABC transporter permease [Rhodovarius crocodyli]RVT90633.1 branched-chain amino acid ABC transporter permease [Rhodovarius crocodyli]